MTSTTDLLAGRYRFVRVLGRGGMSIVFEAVDEHTADAVAVKMVRASDPELSRRLAQEARVLGRVDHPGLVRLRDTGSVGGQTYLVMDLVDGLTLAETLRRGPLGSAATAALGSTVADALAHVHTVGVVHRDLKPSNILLSADGRARLGDFGISRIVDASTLTVAGTTLGTVAYMAPEQLEDHQVGPSADVWSLGIVLLECLTGRRTYEGTASEVVAKRLAGPVPLRDDLPVPWKLLLSGMLDHRPERRLAAADVAAFLAIAPFRAPWGGTPGSVSDSPAAPHDLTALAPGPIGTTLLAPHDTRVAPWAPPDVRRRRWLVALGFLVVAVACLGALDVFGLIGSPGHGTSSAAGAPPSDPTSTPPTTTSAPTTTLPSSQSALGALVRDVTAGVAADMLDARTGRVVSDEAARAVADAASGSTDHASVDLQQAASTLLDSVGGGATTPVEASIVRGDLTTLANTLGLGPAATMPATTTTPQPVVRNGHGNGQGH